MRCQLTLFPQQMTRSCLSSVAPQADGTGTDGIGRSWAGPLEYQCPVALSLTHSPTIGQPREATLSVPENTKDIPGSDTSGPWRVQGQLYIPGSLIPTAPTKALRTEICGSLKLPLCHRCKQAPPFKQASLTVNGFKESQLLML